MSSLIFAACCIQKIVAQVLTTLASVNFNRFTSKAVFEKSFDYSGTLIHAYSATPQRLFEQFRKIDVQGSGDPKERVQSRVADPRFNVTNHRLRKTGLFR